MWNFDRRYSVGFVQPRARVGTHGWIVVFGVCLVFIFNISLLPTFGLIFQPLFGAADNLSLSVATYAFEILTNLTILMTGFLLKDLSAKHFVILGSSMVFLGLLLTSLINSLSELIVTYSAFIGVGLGLLNPACFITILSCFQKSRNQAIGVAFAAMALGQMAMPIIAKRLLEHFDFRLTIVCMASLSFAGVIGANFLAPIKWRNHCEDYENEEHRPLLSNSSKKTFVVVRDVVLHGADLDLLSDFKFWIISIGLALMFALSADFTKILPNFLVDELALSVSQSHICLNVINISDIFARATFTYVTDALEYSSKTVFIIGLIGISLFRVIVMHANLHFRATLICCFLFGAFRAMTVVNQVLIIADFCKKRCPRKLPGTLGLSFVMKSIFLALGAFLYQSIGEDYSLHIYSHIFIQCLIVLTWCCCVI